jgi:hypothetical protein
VKAIRRPSGEKVAPNSADALCVRLTWALPSAFISQMSSSAT